MKLSVKVIPASSRDAIVGWLGDTLKIKVMAPPEKGKANKAVIKLLTKKLNLPKDAVSIINGINSGRKVLQIESVNTEELHKKLN